MRDAAIALCRVSTVRQRLEGSSLEAQEQRIYEAAAQIDAEIVKLWSHDISSRKGKNYKRKDLEEMLAYAKTHKRVKYFIVDEPDRFMRDFDTYFFWKVRFREEANTRLVYAKKAHLAFEDSPVALMEEMIDVFRAESSNQERINKTTANMQARVRLGYFPGKNKPGYKKTSVPGLFEPDEPHWSMLRASFFNILNGSTIKNEVASLNAQGYRTPSGNKLDAFNYKKMLLDPYYAGIIKMSNWEINPQGLHKPMLTKEQHERIVTIATGAKTKTPRKYSNEFCLSNRIECTECLASGDIKHPRLVGFNHNNGKKGDSRKFYQRYKCRGCGALILREELHSKVNEELLNLEFSDEYWSQFKEALRAVWKQDSQSLVTRTRALQNRLEQLKVEKTDFIRRSMTLPISEDDMKAVLDKVDADIKEIEQELCEVGDVEQDFNEFVDFSIDTVENMRKNFWNLDAEHLEWCKQLLFPQGFSVSQDKKVYTPELSIFYRLKDKQKDSEESSLSNMVGPRGFEPLTSTTSMLRSSQMS